MNYEEMKVELINLTPEQRQELLDRLEMIITFGSFETIDFAIASKDQHSKECPHCGKTNFIKWGFKSGHQRYRCKECNGTFSAFTDTFLYNTKVPLDKWLKYCECFVDGKSIKQSAEYINVAITTSFSMRHRLLEALKSSFDDKLEGIIEADETFYPVSYKGNHKKDAPLPRNARKRGSQSKLKGLSREKVCIGVALDNNGHMIIQPICLARVTTNGLASMFDGHIVNESFLYTDRASAYMKIAVMYNLTHVRMRDKSEFTKDVHINHINSAHNNFKLWIGKFRGVSTKYLDNYTCWYKILFDLKQKSHSVEKIASIFKTALSVHKYFKLDYFENKKAYFM